MNKFSASAGEPRQSHAGIFLARVHAVQSHGDFPSNGNSAEKLHACLPPPGAPTSRVKDCASSFAIPIRYGLMSWAASTYPHS